MELQRCMRGHYFDPNVYEICPLCKEQDIGEEASSRSQGETFSPDEWNWEIPCEEEQEEMCRTEGAEAAEACCTEEAEAEEACRTEGAEACRTKETEKVYALKKPKNRIQTGAVAAILLFVCLLSGMAAMRIRQNVRGHIYGKQFLEGGQCAAFSVSEISLPESVSVKKDEKDKTLVRTTVQKSKTVKRSKSKTPSKRKMLSKSKMPLKSGRTVESRSSDTPLPKATFRPLALPAPTPATDSRKKEKEEQDEGIQFERDGEWFLPS